MQKRVVVLSLGGSLIVPNEIDLDFLRKFRDVIKNNVNKFKFVVVCGGGSVSRKYIKALKDDGKNEYLQNLIGISITRTNARFMTHFFGKDANEGIPHDMKHIENLLKKNDIVFCGALRYAPDQTSDTNAVKLAHYFKTDFINLTNVKGLYDKNPNTDKSAKFIPRATIEEFSKIAMSVPQKPGMHAPVDHSAMKLIKKHKIRTIIIGRDAKQFDNFLNAKPFEGSIIEG
jgi:uridylate kinase